MKRMLFLSVILAAGCAKDRNHRDPLMPTARATDSTNVKPASRSGDAPKIEEPALMAADDRKTIPERIKERRDERKNEKAPEKPMLPSAIAPKVPPPTEPAKAEPVNTADAPKPVSELAAVKQLYSVAAAQFDKLTDFQAHMTRREVVKGKDQPAEEVLFHYRKKPFSIYMKNIGEVGRGREVIYVEGQHDGKMHVVMGEGDGSILIKPGTKMAFEPNNPLVTGKSRHKITEAGFGETLTKFGKFIRMAEDGTRPGALKSLGKVDRKEYPYPLDGIDITLQPGDNATLPKGGRKLVYFDMKAESPSYGFPVLVVTQDETGREVEYYLFEKFKNPAGLTDADFDPSRLQSKRR